MSELSATSRPEGPPLAGRRILVTRAADQAAALAEPLAALGAEPVICPTIEIVPAENPAELDAALAELALVDILILSSVNAVKIFLSHLERRDMDPGLLHDKTIVAVGPKTAQAIADHGLQVDLIPEDFRAEGIIEVLSEKVAGKCVLYPKAGLARDLIPRQLRAAGAMVLDPVAYTSGTPADAAEKLAAAIRAGLDLLTFTASSTVHNLVKLIGPATLEQARLVPVASIGPLTSQTAREYGFKVVVEPEESTLDSLVEAIKAYFEAFSSKS